MARSGHGDRVLHPGVFLREPDRCFTAGSSLWRLRSPLSGSPSGPLGGVFWFLLAEQPLGRASTAVSFGRLPGLLRESTGGLTTRDSPPGEHHVVRRKTIRLRHIRQVLDPIRVFSSAWWRHRVVPTPPVRFRFCGPVDKKGTGRVSADARRATVPAGSRSSDPPLVVHRFSTP